MAQHPVYGSPTSCCLEQGRRVHHLFLGGFVVATYGCRPPGRGGVSLYMAGSLPIYILYIPYIYILYIESRLNRVLSSSRPTWSQSRHGKPAEAPDPELLDVWGRQSVSEPQRETGTKLGSLPSRSVTNRVSAQLLKLGRAPDGLEVAGGEGAVWVLNETEARPTRVTP